MLSFSTCITLLLSSQNLYKLLSGWGKIQHPGSAHPMLQEARISILDTQICQQKINKWPYGRLNITEKMVCAGETDSVKSGCHGDSGGPLVCQDTNGRFILHGVVSFGSTSCNTADSYTVFTRVTEYVEWIKQSLWSN